MEMELYKAGHTLVWTHWTLFLVVILIGCGAFLIWIWREPLGILVSAIRDIFRRKI